MAKNYINCASRLESTKPTSYIIPDTSGDNVRDLSSQMHQILDHNDLPAHGKARLYHQTLKNLRHLPKQEPTSRSCRNHVAPKIATTIDRIGT